MTLPKKTQWARVRFRANYEDSRPIIFPPLGPTWETGLAGDGSYATRIAYFPVGEEHRLKEFWPEATDIDWLSVCDEPVFTSRFPKPEWWNP